MLTWSFRSLLLIGLFFACSIRSHVRLTYPPARYPALDFLDNVRTPSPCGVAKPPFGKGIKTSLISQSTFNVSWFQAYPHHGGFRIELLDAHDKLLLVLTDPEREFVGQDDSTQVSRTVTLPSNFECSDCSIRLLRQATEWGSRYHFHSCADIRVVSAPELPSDSCSGHGVRANGVCTCDRLFSGVVCERKDECSTDDDCGPEGKCQQLLSSTSPSSAIYSQRQCFCTAGFYGDMCKYKYQNMELRPLDFDANLYQLRVVGRDKNRIYWRIVDDELEVVLKFPTSSWVAFGWKPKILDGSCVDIGQYGSNLVGTKPEPEGTASAGEPEPEPEPSTAILTSTPEPELKTKPVAAMCPPLSNQVFSACPDSTRLCEASCQWTDQPESIPTCPRECGSPRCICREGYVRKSATDDRCVPFNACLGQGLPIEREEKARQTCPLNSTWVECGRACEPTCANMYDTEPCPVICETPTCSCSDKFVRHNGRCIHWGDCPEYSIPTLAPVVFETSELPFNINFSEFAANIPIAVELPILEVPEITADSLTCSLNETINRCGRACEPDCKTVFTRKQCDLCSAPNCACIEAYARYQGRCLYWNDCPLTVSGLQTAPPNEAFNLDSRQMTKSTILPRSPKTKQNLAPIVVTHEKDRLSTQSSNLAEVIGDVCYGDWRWPPGCRDCDYRVSWNYLDDTDEIEFSIETHAPSNFWTGIGFSSTGTMNKADIIVVKSRNGNLTLHDMYSDNNGVPREDVQQDVYTPTVVGTHVNGVLRVQFMRKRNTGDTVDDHRFTDSNCYKFLFPVSGGRLDDDGRIIAKHIATPKVSANKVCIGSCSTPKQQTAPSDCQHEYRHPIGCEGQSCDYVAKWEYSDADKDVRFEISAREPGRWTGIGFSRAGTMVSYGIVVRTTCWPPLQTNSDIYTGWVYEGQAFVTDRFAYGRQLPAIDPEGRQDIYGVGGKVDDDLQTIWFHRKVVTDDTLTDFPLNKCYYFLFPVGGGRVLARKSQDFQSNSTPIGYHDLYQPRISREKICICDANGKSIADEKPSEIRRQKRQDDPFTVPVNPVFELPPKFEPPSEPEAEPEIVQSEPESSPEGDGRVESESEPEPKAEVDDEISKTIDWTDHPLDCTDIVVGSVVGSVSQVRDYFTISRSTPFVDEYFGGRQSVTSALGYQIDGITTVVFRKKLTAADRTDHSVVPGPMAVFWAKGRAHPGYEHRVEPSVFAAGKSVNDRYYEPDVLNYDDDDDRGQLTLDFFEGVGRTFGIDGQCSGSFSYPEDCRNSPTKECTYSLDWMTDKNRVHFALEAKLDTESWSGVGFSKNGTVLGSDMITVWVSSNGSTTVSDGYFQSPNRRTIDSNNDVSVAHSAYKNGLLIVNFSRKLNTLDTEQDLSLNECRYLLYPLSKGSISDTATIRVLDNTLILSRNKICIHSCSRAILTSGPKLPKKPVNSATPPDVHRADIGFSTEQTIPRYRLSFRILNAEWNSDMATKDSNEFRKLADPIEIAISNVVSNKWPGMQVSDVLQLVDDDGAVKADVELISKDETQEPTPWQLIKHLESRASAGRVGTLQIEPISMQVFRLNAGGSIFEQFHNWLIVGVAGVLVLVVILFAVCMIMRTKQTESDDFKSSSRYAPFSPYSYMFSGYSGSYPGGGYQYPPVPMTDKLGGGFTNQGYAVSGLTQQQQQQQQQQHNRQFSQATTATNNGLGKGSSSASSNEHSPTGGTDWSPVGVGECSYQEWFQKVASNPASQQHQEASERPTMSKPRIGNYAGPYVSYPGDAMSYYTLNGQNRLPGGVQPPPPGYYRPY